MCYCLNETVSSGSLWQPMLAGTSTTNSSIFSSLFSLLTLLATLPLLVLKVELNFTSFQLLVLSLASSALADSAPQYGAPPAYKAPLVKYVEEKLPPQPYAYEYGVADDYSHSNFKKTETQDAGGNVAGSFTIALPDGRIQTTTYTADHTNGFVAEVSYSGEAIFPPAPAGGYPGEAKSGYAPPVPAYNV